MTTKKAKRGWRPRAETLATAEFKKAHAKALAARKKKTCKHGHKLSDPNNVHAGTLLRTGKIMCQRCWEGYAAKYRKPKKAAAVSDCLPDPHKPRKPVVKKALTMTFPATPAAMVFRPRAR